MPNQQDITWQYIRYLVDSGTSERRTLEYKKKLPGRKDEDHREFLYDVTSLANSGGGLLIYGVTDKRNEDGRATGVPEEIVGLDATTLGEEKLRLDNVLRDSVAPRIAGTDWTDVPSPDGARTVLVLRVPRSYQGPHMVKFKGGSAFYARSSQGKYRLDVQEIRSAFRASESLARRIRDFRADRLAMIASGEGPVRLHRPGGVLVIHLVPFAFDGDARAIDIHQVAGALHKTLPPMNQPTYSIDRFNLDGVFTRSMRPRQDGATSYNLFFRDGCLEIVDTYHLEGHKDESGEAMVYADGIAKDLRKVIGQALQLYRIAGIQAPVAIMVSLIDVRGMELKSRRDASFSTSERFVFDRADILLSDHLIEDVDVDVKTATLPILDELWQAAGYERCYLDDANRA